MKKNIFRIIALVIIDQIIKIIVVNTLGVNGGSINIIPNILKLTYLENSFAAFGISLEGIFLIALEILIIFCIIKLMITKKFEVEQNIKFGLSLILAGGFGNLIDRIIRGCVIDYIDITNLFNWPIFNFADICIVSGVIFIVVMILINTVKRQENINERT